MKSLKIGYKNDFFGRNRALQYSVPDLVQKIGPKGYRGIFKFSYISGQLCIAFWFGLFIQYYLYIVLTNYFISVTRSVRSEQVFRTLLKIPVEKSPC